MIKIAGYRSDAEKKEHYISLFSQKIADSRELGKFIEQITVVAEDFHVEISYATEISYASILHDGELKNKAWQDIVVVLKNNLGARLLPVLEKSKYTFTEDGLVLNLPEGMEGIFFPDRTVPAIRQCLRDMFSENIQLTVNANGVVLEHEEKSESVEKNFSDEEYEKEIAENIKKNKKNKSSYGEKGKSVATGQTKFYKGGTEGAKNADKYMGDGSKKRRRITPEEGEELAKDSHGNSMIIGGEIIAQPIAMRDITQDSGYVAVRGRLFKYDEKKMNTKNSYIASLYLTDNTYSIIVKFFYDEEDLKFVHKTFAVGKYFTAYGLAQYDTFIKDVSIKASNISTAKHSVRMDNAEVKRVELHLHTNLSQQDAITRPGPLIDRLNLWGHKAVAITDHGVVQAYPDVFNAVKNTKSKIKVIYGMECYLTDQTGKVTKEEAKDIKSWHCIILVKDNVGLKNLYKLISKSNIDYFYKKPRIPRFELENMREGLIIGSACSEGELFHAAARGADDETLMRMASFYDYLEIQPAGNDMYLIREGVLNSVQDLQNVSKKIVEIGDRLGKMTVATCDVHFLDPEDSIYRCVLQAGQGFKDAEQQPPIFLRTTDEMLAEFSYLGNRAYEIVVENTNKIADIIEPIRPVPAGNFDPSIAGSDDIFRESSYEKAKKTYGDPVPQHIMERLDKELNAIISNGYSVMYIAAQKLVAESARNGYTVGSRGSVGSSLAAYMAGITEINSLPPHYRCPDCFYQEFFFNQEYDMGCDMPDKECPNCHKPLIKDGFDIPFETFLGFKGDKVPDIDLNFASEDQPNAHKYCEVIFGSEYVYRAGTIAGLAEKTARGYVLKYLEATGRTASNAEIDRLASGFEGVKRTTGQHPGGIMVVPKTMDIFDFTAIQHPAEKDDSDTITTHFDYHFLHDNILKLDILGHDGPAIIKNLEEFTGVSTDNVNMADPKLMSLFTSSEALEMDPEVLKIPIDIGTLGIPEFGTPFAIGLLKDTHPTTVSELVRISGLSHGTDVWQGNAQELIKEGKTNLKGAICCRDDIMLYLITKGLDKGLSFKIMEAVRKGKGLTPEWEEEMVKHNVPDWYIWSCKKIKYMFPKAHAAAYVLLSVRMAWYKLYYPLAYYATRFTLKVGDFDGIYMLHGVDKAYNRMMEIKNTASPTHKLSAKEDDQLTIYEQLMEMYARHVEFLPVDIYKSEAVKFVPEDGKLRPPFCSLAGVGTSAGEAMVEARKNGPYESVLDFQERTGANKSVIELLRGEGCFEGLRENDENTLFNFGDD